MKRVRFGNTIKVFAPLPTIGYGNRTREIMIKSKGYSKDAVRNILNKRTAI